MVVGFLDELNERLTAGFDDVILFRYVVNPQRCQEIGHGAASFNLFSTDGFQVHSIFSYQPVDDWELVPWSLHDDVLCVFLQRPPVLAYTRKCGIFQTHRITSACYCDGFQARWCWLSCWNSYISSTSLGNVFCRTFVTIHRYLTRRSNWPFRCSADAEKGRLERFIIGRSLDCSCFCNSTNAHPTVGRHSVRRGSFAWTGLPRCHTRRVTFQWIWQSNVWRVGQVYWRKSAEEFEAGKHKVILGPPLSKPACSKSRWPVLPSKRTINLSNPMSPSHVFL